jgi:PAS domain S-box-containing protein
MGGAQRDEAWQAYTVRLAWATDARGVLVNANQAFCAVMGYSQQEVADHPGMLLLRPHTSSDDPEILALTAAKHRLERRQSVEEHLVSWIETRDGQRIDLPDAVMTYDAVHFLWEVAADVTLTSIPSGPQFRTPWQKELLYQWQLEHLTRTVQDMGKRFKQVPLEEDLLADHLLRLKKKPQRRKPRPDKGARAVSEADFDQRLRVALGDGKVTVKAVLEATHVGHHVTLHGYLAPYRGDREETPGQTINRLRLEWFPDRYF